MTLERTTSHLPAPLVPLTVQRLVELIANTSPGEVRISEGSPRDDARKKVSARRESTTSKKNNMNLKKRVKNPEKKKRQMVGI